MFGYSVLGFGSGSGSSEQPELPTDGLSFALDGKDPLTFFSDLAKTTNSTEGGSVAVWADVSGNGNDWTQSNATYRPLAQLSSQRLYNNGTGSGGVGKHLIGPNISSWTAGSFFARFIRTAGPAGAIWGTTGWNSVNSLGHWNYPPHYTCFGCDARASYSWVDTETALMTYEENVAGNGTLQNWVNGVNRYNTDVGNVTFRTAPYLGCGVRGNNPEYSIGGYYYRVCGYNKVVTTEERALINAWLAA